MFSLPELPYSYDALTAAIDAQTMEIHHSKHHNAYVTNLNTAVGKIADLQTKSLEQLITKVNDLPADVRTAIRNNGGGHWNHAFFWQILISGDKAKKKPVGKLAEAVDRRFGSFERLKEEFTTAATGRFGSGWAWLILKEGELYVTSTPNQDNPLMDVAETQGKPILGLDVWEHAYYLRYQNRRPEYVTNFWEIVNWEKAEELFVG